jgi:hypothetical protein
MQPSTPLLEAGYWAVVGEECAEVVVGSGWNCDRGGFVVQHVHLWRLCHERLGLSRGLARCQRCLPLPQHPRPAARGRVTGAMGNCPHPASLMRCAHHGRERSTKLAS